MIPDKPYPKVPKNIAGSKDITESARLANEVLTGVGSSDISDEFGVGGSLSMIIEEIRPLGSKIGSKSDVYCGQKTNYACKQRIV